MRLRILYCFGIGLFFCGGHAAAQPSGAPSAAENTIERARDHMERGQELYVQGRYVEAAEEFEAAYAAQPFSAFLYNEAVAYERHGDPNRAAGLFERYLTSDPNAADASEVRGRIERLRSQSGQTGTPAATTAGATPPTGGTPTTGTASPETPGTPATTPTAPIAPPGTDDGIVRDTIPQEFKSLISIRTNPEGARVTLKQNGHVIGSGPAPFAYTLEQGDYEVSIEHPDYRTVQQTVRIRPGKVYVVIVEMSQGQFLGFLRVISNVPGSQVFLDDHNQGSVGNTPYQNAVSTGSHHVWIERPGYAPLQREVEVGIGEDVTLRVDMTRVNFGRLRVVANVRGAAVYVDDQKVGNVPWEGQVNSGARRVRIESDDMKDWEETVTIRQGQLTPVRVRLRPAVGRGGAWVTASLSVALITGGIVMGVLSNGIKSDLEHERDAGTLSSDDSRFLEGQILSIGADAAFGLGAVLAGLATYYFVRDPLPDSEGTVLEPRDWSFAPSVSTDGASGTMRWSF